MNLTVNYIHPTPHGGRCRVRIYLPDKEEDVPVVCSELSDNGGISVTNATERIAAEVSKRCGLPVPVWIEQRTAETAQGPEEKFALVIFSHHEVRELSPYVGVSLTIREPTWKLFDRASVAVSVGQEV